MEWFIFVATIIVAINGIAMIHFNIELAEAKSKINRMYDLQYNTLQIADRLEDNVIQLRTNVDCVWDNTERIAEGLDAMNASFNTPAEPETAEELTPDASELTQNELERLARKREFDKRIADLREELGYESYGTHAEEEHPDVKNLPHNIIPVSLYDLPDVEIAE